MSWRATFPAIALLAACGSDESFTIVTVETRPAVHDAKELSITLSNAGSMRNDRLTLGGNDFPTTFSISAPERTGELVIQVDALDEAGLLVGRGTATTTVAAPEARVVLDSADFVVNTDFLDDQFPSDDFESHGFQIAATQDGDWTVVYRDRCLATGGCNMFARRFDVTGKPLESGLAAGPQGFPVSTSLTTGVATPAVASAGQNTIAVWDFSEPSPSTIDGITCRPLDAGGNSATDQVNVSVEQLPDVVSATGLSNGTFAVSWNGFGTENNIKGAIVSSQCAPSNLVQVNTLVGTAGASRGAVTSNGDRILYAWILDGDVRARIASNTNSFLTADIPIVTKTATEEIQFVRVAPLGLGFAVVVRWALSTGSTGPGRLELYRINNGGGLMGGPTLISTRSGTEFDSREAFGVAGRADGALLVVWHACEANGDGSSCGVFGRVFRPSGVPVGDEFVVPTTTEGDQSNPSAVGLPGGAFAATWMDLSGKDPDKSGSSARARILYPPYDDARGVIGAVCTTTAECGPNLACGPSTDGGQRCFATCDPQSPPPQCPAGGTCTTVPGGAACTF
ncbi:MAG TPA: hypothetical protein VFQ53_10085 [Kofleriaceae bacterium]|nr:hypothetical protein [Kofleriaceae bacterium]